MKRVDLLDVPDEARDLIRECEVQGTRTLFERGGRAVAVLVSWDEYLAMQETIDIANDALLYARIAEADDASSRRAGELPDAGHFERIRIAPPVEHDYGSLGAEEQPEAMEALRRIDDDPIVGAPLFEPLKGLWTYRAGRLRIIYRVVTEGRFVLILSITRAGIDSAP